MCVFAGEAIFSLGVGNNALNFYFSYLAGYLLLNALLFKPKLCQRRIRSLRQAKHASKESTEFCVSNVNGNSIYSERLIPGNEDALEWFELLLLSTWIKRTLLLCTSIIDRKSRHVDVSRKFMLVCFRWVLNCEKTQTRSWALDRCYIQWYIDTFR